MVDLRTKGYIPHTHKHLTLLFLIIRRIVIAALVSVVDSLISFSFLTVAASVIKNANWEWQSNRKFHHRETEWSSAKICGRQSVSDWTLWWLQLWVCFVISHLWIHETPQSIFQIMRYIEPCILLMVYDVIMLCNQPDIKENSADYVLMLWMVDPLTNPLNPPDPCVSIYADAQIRISTLMCVLDLEILCSFQTTATSALNTPSSAPRCTEAESRMEQSYVQWQWHPSHAMNNQWTPSGAYNRGAQHQSLSSGWHLSLFLSPSHTVSRFSTTSLTCSLFLFPTHITATRLLCLIVSSSGRELCALMFPPVFPSPPLPLFMLLSDLCDRLVMVSLILIQQYNSPAANKWPVAL